MTTVLCVIGPDDIACEVKVVVTPGEPVVMYDWNNEGYPGSDPEAEMIDGSARIIEGGKRRRLTDEEELWLENEREAIEEKALEEEFDYSWE